MKAFTLFVALAVLCLSVPAFGSVLKVLRPPAPEASCSLVGKWESTKNDLHVAINISFVFKNDSTYEANVRLSSPVSFLRWLEFMGPCC
jgi:hypothetical protein